MMTGLTLDVASQRVGDEEQRLQRLAQVMAGRRQERRLGETGSLRLFLRRLHGRLALPQPLLGLLARGDVAHDAGEEPLTVGAPLGDGELQRERRAVLAPASDLA